MFNNKNPGKWIGRGDPVPRPPRSPDLNPLALMKDAVYIPSVLKSY
jgi:hypothetical protein